MTIGDLLKQQSELVQQNSSINLKLSNANKKIEELECRFEGECDLVNQTKLAGHHVCAIGTSVVKATESAVGTDGMLKEFDGWTNKFIFPPYDFGLADCMVANFYHPESPLMMSTAAFGGYDLVYSCYKKAVKNGYMFGCFGDSLLILND